MSVFPRGGREQGTPGACCTRGLVCKVHKRKRTRAYRYSRSIPAFPAQWFYGLCRALPGDEFVLSPSSADERHVRPRSGRLCRSQLDTSNGRQDHTVLPYAATRLRQKASPGKGSFVLRACWSITRFNSPCNRNRANAVASTTSRPAFVTTRDRPSYRNGMAID